MIIKAIARIFIFFTSTLVVSQDNLHTVFGIPDDLTQNANAVVRMHDVTVLLKSSNEMHVTEKRIITVLNKKGNDAVDAFVHYDNNLKIKDLEVLVFNAVGAQIKKIKKNDFKDVSAVDGGTLYSDSRVKYLDYTPIAYPYTIEFVCETVNNNTAFIQSFRPLNDYYISVQNGSYTIEFPENLTVRTKEKNFEGLDLKTDESPGKYHYEVKHINAYKKEDYSPSFTDMVPKILVASTQFALEGVETQVENWNEFGKWMYHDLIKDTYDLPASTVSMIQDLVKNESSDIDKAKKIYEYVQNKTRYISVQVGIGGWKPFKASEVDRLGYGDCKALTNYTMSLLKSVGVESNYSVVWRYTGGKSIEKDFTSMQGNHAFLHIPAENNTDIWLECTSQKLPFGFIANSTDDRDVLVITPEGGTIKHTKKYGFDENIQTITGSYSISNDGGIDASANVVSKGIQYDNKYLLETETERDLDEHYKKRWKYINSISISKMAINNNKNDIAFIEDVSFQASNYSKVIGNRMLLTLNALNRTIEIPDRYRDRKLPLKISRGFKDIDNIEIKLPEDYKIESLPTSKSLVNKFGSYTMEIDVKEDNIIIYKREFVVKDGSFPKEDYEEFREFYKEVSKWDNAKVALITKSN